MTERGDDQTGGDGTTMRNTPLETTVRGCVIVSEGQGRRRQRTGVVIDKWEFPSYDTTTEQQRRRHVEWGGGNQGERGAAAI